MARSHPDGKSVLATRPARDFPIEDIHPGCRLLRIAHADHLRAIDAPRGINRTVIQFDFHIAGSQIPQLKFSPNFQPFTHRQAVILHDVDMRHADAVPTSRILWSQRDNSLPPVRLLADNSLYLAEEGR